jgi:hypothetical protein
VAGMMAFLWKRQTLLKDFGAFAEATSKRVKEASCQAALDRGRPIEYLQSSRTDKEAIARQIASRDNVTQGLIAVLTCVEPCMSYEIYRNRETQHLELKPRIRKGLHVYQYFIDPRFGFMNARIQTWFPFNIQICINGREWLSRQMDRAGLSYQRRENCFVGLADVGRAQTLLHRQLRIAWPGALRRIARQLNPAHEDLFGDLPSDYYWSAYQSEWATDLMFRDSASLAQIYPALVLHGITTFSSADVMRFLGGKVHGAFKGQIISDFKDRPEGVRIKHGVGQNSVKMYDKQGSVLRVETTINQPYAFKVFRPKEGEPRGQKQWRPMRKGIADLHRRAHVSQASNERYLKALAAVNTSTPLAKLVKDLCRPTTCKGQRIRALRPWDAADQQLFETVMRGEFCVNGFRNRDLQRFLFEGTPDSPQEKRRRGARVTRRLRLLRAHGLVTKVQSTHRYVLSDKGRQVLAALLASQRLTMDQINKAAA